MHRLLIVCGTILTVCAQDKPAVHFHHVHINSTDPAAAIEFYTHHFDCEKSSYRGQDAVLAQKSWLLFNKVSSAAPFEVVSAIWHIGWGAEDMPATYRKQLDMGTAFQTPITDISGLANSPNFFYAYVDGPGHELIELNTSAHHHFGHLTPVQRRSINVIIFPMEHARQTFPAVWKDRKGFESSRGRVIDHVAFSVDDLEATKERLRKAGIAVDQEGFLDGPDHIHIELVAAEH